MKTPNMETLGHVVQPQMTEAPPLSERFLKIIARVLLPVISLSVTLPQSTFAAPSPSLLMQEPRFLDVVVEPNVMFIMDDSLSMDDIRLPVPAGLNPDEANGSAMVTVKGRMRRDPVSGVVAFQAGYNVPRVNEWIYRSSTLNPLYYNRATLYRPWNDNGRLDTGSNTFPNSSTSIATRPNGFREGLVAHDMRYAGPNFESGRPPADFSRRITTTGANPVLAAAYQNLPTHPQNGGFFGGVDGSGRNQDIFSSIMGLSGSSQVCTVPLLNQDVTTLTPISRGSQAQSYVLRDSARNFFERPNTVMGPDQQATYDGPTNQEPTTTYPTISNRAITNRTLTTRMITNRVITDPTISNRTITDRTTSARTITTRASTPQIVANRPPEYSIETGTCGNYGPWLITMPAPGFCSDATSESGVRAALIQTRDQPCPSGTSTVGLTCVTPCAANTSLIGSQCVADCASGSSAISATQCTSNCPGGFGVVNNNTCISNCPANTGVYSGNNNQCISNCPSGTGNYGATQCIANCVGGTPFGTNQCISTCPSGTADYGTTQCRSNCAGTPVGTDQCLSSCPTGTTSYGTDQCIANCPANTSNYGTTQCLADCAGAGTPSTSGGLPICLACPALSTYNATTGTCQSCSSGTYTSNPNTGQMACRVCATGYAWNSTVNLCRANCASGVTGTVSGNLVCYSACTGTGVTTGTGSNFGQCLNSCPGGTPLSAQSLTCRSTCGAGFTGTVGGQQVCYNACPSGFPTDLGTTCYAGCPITYPVVNPSNSAQCIQSCPSGSMQSGTTCSICPAGSQLWGSGGQCCPNAGISYGCPANRSVASCTANTYYADLDTPAPARFYVFNPGNPASTPANAANLANPAYYEMFEINRDMQRTFPWGTNNYPNRTDCGTSSCPWQKEAENFANWYTYYRTRLFAAIAVTADALSRLRNVDGRDALRLGYGSINHFPLGGNPFGGTFPDPDSVSPASVDGVASLGAIVRGVRPFTESAANPRRQEVFNWLFSLRAIGSTPNREALDSVGRYFMRTDNRGPWSDNPETGNTRTPHLTCRRNYAILVTDGEWTRAPYVASAPQQPLMENRNTPLNVLRTDGPTLVGAGEQNGRSYTYRWANEVQFSTNSNAAGGTLSDVALYYWSRDLRTDLQNNIEPTSSNPAFWQHLTPYIVGYGISPSRDNSGTRGAISSGGAVSWPTVAMENRSSSNQCESGGTIINDSQPFPKRYDATAMTCVTDVNLNICTDPAGGCGRVDDTFRAAMAGRGDFLAAADVGQLAQGVASIFGRIRDVTGSATAVGGRSASLQAGDRLYFANFVTNRWSGRVDAYDAGQWTAAVSAGTVPPNVIATSNFPAADARNIVTSTAATGGGVDFRFANLLPTQRASLSNDATLVDYLRGDPSLEARNNVGTLRNRFFNGNAETLADIVNSTPLFSKAPDARYTAGRRPAGDTDSNANGYRNHVNLNRQHRPPTIFVGANDGMLHAFDAATLTESFAYVPRAMYPQLPQLASPSYVHKYFVDGPVVEGDVFVGGSWKTVVVGTSGAGPKSVFALDVTLRNSSGPQAFSTGNVLFDIAGSDSGTSDLGHITQPGVIGSGTDGKWYYFVGNGWESANDKAVLLAIDISNGQITSIPTDNVGTATMPNGLGGVTPVYDANRNIVGIYAGDRLGRLWKFDVNFSNLPPPRRPTGSTLLFTAVNAGGEAQPIAAAPRVMSHPLGGRLVAVGTGRLHENLDPASMSVQSLYAIWERNPNAPVTVLKSDLSQFNFTEQGVTPNRVRILNGQSSLNWGTHKGWYVDLLAGGNATGERVIVTPIEAFGFLNVTTFEPAAGGDLCKGGGQSFFYRFDIAGNFTRVPFSSPPATSGGVAANTVVGTEMPPTIGGLRLLGSSSPSTAAVQSSVNSTELNSLFANTTRASSTDPCSAGNVRGYGRTILNAAAGTLQGACPIPAQRVWRELPRGAR